MPFFEQERKRLIRMPLKKKKNSCFYKGTTPVCWKIICTQKSWPRVVKALYAHFSAEGSEDWPRLLKVRNAMHSQKAHKHTVRETSY